MSLTGILTGMRMEAEGTETDRDEKRGIETDRDVKGGD